VGFFNKIKSWLNIGGERLAYYVTATASVKGAAFDPSDTVAVAVVD
jgi:hypothetical protein